MELDKSVRDTFGHGGGAFPFTIGRIELRSAPTGPPAPRKAPAAAPRVTLDAYAKLRETRR